MDFFERKRSLPTLIEGIFAMHKKQSSTDSSVLFHSRYREYPPKIKSIVRSLGKSIEQRKHVSELEENAWFISALGVVVFRYTQASPVIFSRVFSSLKEPEAVYRSSIECHLSSEKRFDSLVYDVCGSLESQEESIQQGAPGVSHATVLIERSSRRSRLLQAVDQWVECGSTSPASRKWSDTLCCFWKAGSEVKLEVRYDASAHSRNDVLGLIDCICQAWRHLSRQSSVIVDDIELISPNVRKKLLNQFIGQTVAYSREKTILDLFEDQAISSPQKTALVFGQRNLTYSQLDRKSNTLAHQLFQSGIKKGDLVPIIFNNSLELPLSMLALLKTEAAFVPVDDGWPQDRIEGILKNLRPKVVLAAGSFPMMLAYPRVNVDSMQLAEAEEGPQRGAVSFKDLIYGFFTSGSTGIPKCTLNCHGGLVNRFLYMTRRFKPRAQDVVLQNSKQVFDSSIWQLLWPLTCGAEVVIPEPRGVLDLSYTVELISRHQVTMTDFVPSIFNTLVDYLDHSPDQLAKLQSLRQLLIGGEEMNARPVYKFMSHFPKVGITNTYGPTEASIGMIFHEVSSADGDTIPLGRPIDNTYAVVLDERLRLVPPGVIGEIYIGGDCLGQGYLGDPEKTRLAFIKNPYSAIPGDRLYRTGDLGYISPDGKFRFAGRKDQQVKVGGVRVELGEIENVLQKHEQILEAKIVVEDLGEHQKRLVAFVVGRGQIDLSSVRGQLQRLLPANIIPKRIIVLDAIPLTPNGKADRKALQKYLEAESPAEVENGSDSDSGSELEEAIRLLWQDNLKKSPIGLSEDYFETGGDSLTAVRLIGAIQKNLGIKLRVRDFYQNPTIRKLADLSNKAPEQQTETENDRPWTVDLAMPLDIQLASYSPAPSYRRVLLTGATGFIGTRLLAGLLEEPVTTVFCLVRGNSVAEAREKLNDSLIEYGFRERVNDSRIEIVLGDLELPRLGCTDSQYERLSAEVDGIIHCGAMVNFMHDYRRLRQCNVLGSQEILHLAARVKLKPLIYVSSLSFLFDLKDRSPSDRVLEDSDITELNAPAGGYNQSKWVAEVILQRGRELGIPVSIVRLGEVMPHSVKGIPNRKALPFFLMKASSKLAVYPKSTGRMDYMPVDAAGRFILHVLKHRSHESKTYHVFHPKGISIEQMMAAFANNQPNSSPVDYATFWNTLNSLCSGDSHDPDLMSLLLMLPSPFGKDMPADPVSELFITNLEAIDCANAAAIWREIGDFPQDIDERNLIACRNYLDLT